ncbi:hypothetical protein L914_02655 [Phytophthora nicotianae]|uniref:Uncharacterized protein n=1 Tax=Phytophthora nicotianae TaxID=4792 RepID=W2NZC5_PHYNI|nr:hypothetical protein L914_02655 [Phytophthora nicotianae]
MARTHKTALIKQQMADREAARTAGNNHIEAEEATASAEGNNDGGAVHYARTRSEKADAIQKAEDARTGTLPVDASALEEKAPATSATVDTSEASEGVEEEEEESSDKIPVVVVCFSALG